MFGINVESKLTKFTTQGYQHFPTLTTKGVAFMSFWAIPPSTLLQENSMTAGGKQSLGLCFGPENGDDMFHRNIG
jgi:hypothetical protein